MSLASTKKNKTIFRPTENQLAIVFPLTLNISFYVSRQMTESLEKIYWERLFDTLTLGEWGVGWDEGGGEGVGWGRVVQFFLILHEVLNEGLNEGGTEFYVVDRRSLEHKNYK